MRACLVPGLMLFAAAPLHAQPGETLLAPPVPAEPLPTPAASDSLVHDGVAVYRPDFFRQFAPRSALDMLDRVPGFSVQAESSARGLGQASGNVLINGKRLASKADSARDQLSRIPAANVIRIEIVDGATLDIPGLSGRVANIVVQSTSSFSGQFEWEPQLPTEFAAGRWSQGRISVSGSTGPLGYTVALANQPFRGGTGGSRRFYDAAGTLTEDGFITTRSFSDSPRLSTTLRIDGPGSSTANLNLSYQWNQFRSRDQRDRALPGMIDDPFAIETIANRNRGHNYEIGADVEFALGPGRLKLIGLERYRTSNFSTEFLTDRTDGPPDTGSRFGQASQSGERIGRAEYGWQMWGADWQLSAEAAFNRLHNSAELYVRNPAGSFIQIPFPSGTGGVTEDRYEGSLSYGRPLAENLTLQLLVGAEYSKIAQTGPNAEQRSFTRPKGSLSLAWAAAPGTDVSIKLRRAVGQLEFADFLADVNLSNNNTNAGNNQLKPNQRWELDLEVAKNLGPWGSATVKLYQQWITDFVTIVPLPGGGESQGNIPSASLRGIMVNGTLNLSQLGWKGARFDISADFQESKLTDPVTGDQRFFDRTRPRNVELDLRHDVPGSDWAWGLGFRNTKFAPYYRIAEFGYDYNIETFGAIFLENKDVFGLTVRVRMANLLAGKAIYDRTVFSGPRDSSAISFVESQRRRVGVIWNFLVKGNF